MQYVYFRCATKRGSYLACAAAVEYERIAVDEDLRLRLGDRDWNDANSWEDSGVDIDDCTEMKNLYPLSGEPCFAIVRLFNEYGEECLRIVVNADAEILSKELDLIERIF